MSSFLEYYEKPAILGKALEVRWFGHGHSYGGNSNNKDADQGGEGPSHSALVAVTKMPFLRRNLQYSRYVTLENDRHTNEHGSMKRQHRQVLLQRKRERQKKMQHQYTYQYQARSKLHPIQKKEMNLLDDIHVKMHFSRDKQKKQKYSHSHNHQTQPYISCLNFGTNIPPSSMNSGRRKTGKSFSPIPTGTGMAVMDPNNPNSNFNMNNHHNHKKTKLKPGETPTPPKHAFVFFCEANRRKREEELVEIWNDELSNEEKNFWIWREIRDRRRYLHEQKVCRNGIFEVQKGHVIFYYFSIKDENGNYNSYDDNIQAQGDNNGNGVASSQSYTSYNTSTFTSTAGVGATTLVDAQLEKRTDRRCPFCFYNGVSNRGLLLHCKTVHGGENGEIAFDAGIDAENNLHMTVKNRMHNTKHDTHKHTKKIEDDNFMFLWKGRDACQRRSCDVTSKFGTHQHVAVAAAAKGKGKAEIKATGKQPKSQAQAHESLPTYFDGKMNLNIPFVKKPTHLTCGMETTARKKKIRQLGQQQRMLHDNSNSATNGANQYQYQHPKALSEYVGDDQVPIRQYVHSKTMQPMAPGDWDVDSDDEEDDLWLHALGESLMNELGDVSSKEKKFMNMWNRFMRSHTLVADHVVPSKCEEFMSKHLPLLIKFDLRQQFMLHLFNLWDNSLLPSRGIVALMQRYDAFSLDEKENNRKVAATPSAGNEGDCSGSDDNNDDDDVASQALLLSLKRKRAAMDEDEHPNQSQANQNADSSSDCDNKIEKLSDSQLELAGADESTSVVAEIGKSSNSGNHSSSDSDIEVVTVIPPLSSSSMKRKAATGENENSDVGDTNTNSSKRRRIAGKDADIELMNEIENDDGSKLTKKHG